MGRQATFDRKSVLQQAMELFWARGYQGTSLKDLEKALDMRPGSIYAAFGSKEALFRTALELYSETAREALETTLGAAPTPLDGLAQHVRNLGRVMDAPIPARACMLVKTLLEVSDDDPIIRDAAEDMLRQTEAVFAAAFRAAQATGKLAAEKDPDRLASRLQAEIFGLRAYAQRSDAGQRVVDMANDIARDLEALAI